jgi:ammonium transporter, Amt family
VTRRLPLRVGLVAFVVAVLLGVFLSLPAIHSSYAQAPATAPAEPAAAAPADVPTPACDPKTLLNCSRNSGDTAWMLTSVALVLMMTIPGLGLFYCGMKNEIRLG